MVTYTVPVHETKNICVYFPFFSIFSVLFFILSDTYSIIQVNFDDEMKRVAQQKIKDKILQQRKVRAEQLALESEISEEDNQEELEIEQQIEEEKVKKNRELKEFWD